MGSHSVGVVGDEENPHNGIRIQPVLISTPMAERWKSEGGRKRNVTMGERLGLNELFSPQVWRASLAELLGTAMLVFLIDTIVISSIQTHTNTPNLIMSVLVAIVIAILLLATIPASGGHINPVATFSAALLGLVSFSRAAVYFLAQCLGGMLGALALKAVVSSSIEETFSLGGCTLSVVEPGQNGPITLGLETGQALWIEVICTFVFLFASVWIAFDERQARSHGLVVVCSIIGTVLGLLVFVSTTVTATKGYAGAGMNPARCLGPALVRGGHLWDGHWVFWAGPAIACMAFYLYIKIIPDHHFKHPEHKHDFLNLLRHSFK